MTPEAGPPLRLRSQRDGRLRATLQAHGGLHTLRSDALTVNLFPASALEAGPANLWLRWQPAGNAPASGPAPVPLLGPASPGRAHLRDGRVWHEGVAGTVHFQLELVLAAEAQAWFWHLALRNTGTAPVRLDLVYLQDVALAPWSAIRLNEAYVSQYLDHQPLRHGRRGWTIATRQGQPVQGRVPWLLSGSLGQAVAFATDALQVAGLAQRAGVRHGLLEQALPGTRLQHEHALVGLQEAVVTLAPGEQLRRGFYGWLQADHPAASSTADLASADAASALPEATDWEPPSVSMGGGGVGAGDDARNLFACVPPFPAEQPDRDRLQAWFGDAWRHEETGPAGEPLAFFQDGEAHVVTRAHELRVLRPHGHLLRSGSHWTPDEQAVASTVWMAGVFHSSLTQGHASANRLLSTQRGYLGLFRGQGLRLFVDGGQGWQLLDVPSAMRMGTGEVTWVYQAGERCIEVVADAAADAPQVGLRLRVRQGGAIAVLVSLHLAINARDGSDGCGDEGPVAWRTEPDPDAVGGRANGAGWLQPAPGSDLAGRFPDGGLRLCCRSDGQNLSVQGDEALFLDGRSRHQPYLCLRLAAVRDLQLTLHCALVPPPGDTQPAPLPGGAQPPVLRWQPQPEAGAAGLALSQLGDWLPWLAHNALVHYLTPRGLEQFSGGGWGTRDVCQGPAELLLALGRFDALRDLLCRVFSAQNVDGDWPQWFMFYPRDAQIRAGDSHGDVVFWPLVALADYLVATRDAALLDEPLPYHAVAAAARQSEPLAGHVARALAVVRRRTIAGTRLAAYGHGDWNDALQPADPAMREHLCSAWTVTLHHRMLRSLAAAWHGIGRMAESQVLADEAQAVLADFQRLLLVDGVVTGYASFERGAVVDHLLHPRDARTGIRYSALPMVHAILDGLFTPAQAASHAALIAAELSGPDGLRLFDRPLRYRGGPMTLFQRGESASYFGREIGLMYMHAHLRWAEALALLGRADEFLHALQLANPIGLQALVPQAAPRQRNCYYSSSDAAFADRDEAARHYDRIDRGDVALEGGWRIYSSGAGIAYRLVLQRLLGLTEQVQRLGIDPVLSPRLDGLRVQLPLYGHGVEVHYRVGPCGHGPLAVALDGEPLALQPGDNPYRKPGIWLNADPMRARLAGGARQLQITLA